MSRPADILLKQGDTLPVWPTIGQTSIYAKTDGLIYSLDANGVEISLSNTGTILATNISGGVTGSILYQAAPGVTIKLPPGTEGQILTMVSGVPAWVTP